MALLAERETCDSIVIKIHAPREKHHVPKSPRARAHRYPVPHFVRLRARIETRRSPRSGSRSRHVAHRRHSQSRGCNHSESSKTFLLSNDIAEDAFPGPMVGLRGRKHRHLEKRMGRMVLRRALFSCRLLLLTYARGARARDAQSSSVDVFSSSERIRYANEMIIKLNTNMCSSF